MLLAKKRVELGAALCAIMLVGVAAGCAPHEVASEATADNQSSQSHIAVAATLSDTDKKENEADKKTSTDKSAKEAQEKSSKAKAEAKTKTEKDDQDSSKSTASTGSTKNKSETKATGRSKESATATQAAAAVTSEWASKTDCATCHTTEGDSLEDSACVASHHASLTCVTCHTEVDNLETIHADTKKAKPGRIRRLKDPVKNETCLSCHGSMESLAEKTADSTVLTDSKGTTVNPHAIPENEGHPTEVACSECHGIHKEFEPAQYCIGCHHTNVYECNTCHD